jgi:uncharacterized membrane protein YphA (DoxX/SURF4 family)
MSFSSRRTQPNKTRNMLRFLGLISLVAIFAASGYFKIVSPQGSATYLAKSNFPMIVNEALKLAQLKYKLTANDYVLIIQATGGIFVSFSAFIVLNIGRRFFSFLLAMGLVFITACFHVNIANPAATSQEEQIQVLKNLAIVGGLLVVAGTGPRRSSPAAVASDASKKSKKNQ